MGNTETLVFEKNGVGTKYRWVVIICCALSYFFDSYDVFILGIAMPSITGTLGMTATQGGLLASSTMMGAVFGSLFLGRFASNRGNKFCLVACTAWIGLGSLSVVFVKSFAMWFILRFITGIGIGGILGPIHALVWQHWGPKYCAKVTGIAFCSYPVAGIVSSLVGKLVLVVDFRWIFVSAACSIFVAIISHILIPDDRHLTPAGSTGAAGEATEKVKFSDIFVQNYKWITLFAILASFCNMAGAWAMNTWIPTWLVTDHGVDIGLMTNFTLVNHCGCLIGYLVWGSIASKIGSGKSLGIAFAITAVFLLLYIITPGQNILFFLGPLLYFGQGGIGCLTSVLYAEAYPARIRAYGTGTAFNFGRIGSIISPYTVAVVGTAFGLSAGLLMAPCFFGIGIAVTVGLSGSMRRQKSLENGKASDKESSNGGQIGC